MPLIVGAIAAAIIVSYQDSGLAQNRLTDSSNAQISSEYFIRDVQGAQYVTTIYAPRPVAARSSGCTGSAPSPERFVAGARAHRPAADHRRRAGQQSLQRPVRRLLGDAGNDSQMQLVRYSCPQRRGADHRRHVGRPTSPPRSPHHPAGPVRDSATQVGPPPRPRPSSHRAFTLPCPRFPWSSTAGFASRLRSACGPSTGFQTLSCTVALVNHPRLPADGSGTVQNGAQVRQQASISGISISVTQPGERLHLQPPGGAAGVGVPTRDRRRSGREPRMPPPSSASAMSQSPAANSLGQRQRDRRLRQRRPGSSGEMARSPQPAPSIPTAPQLHLR